MSGYPIRAPEPSSPLPAGVRPTFSVVIAAYQAADVIGEALQSALTQTLPPHEVIVCDDGSTDDLDGALTPYLDQIVLLRKPNGGEASAKNRGIAAATGEFVVFLDADDVFAPDRLAALSELAADRPDLDVLTTDAILELDGRAIRQCYTADLPFETADQRTAILQRNFVFGLAGVRRTRLLAVGGFDESIRWTTDWECWIRLILSGSLVGLVDAPLATYRLHQGSLSSQRRHLLAGRVQTLEKTLRRTDLSPADRRVLIRSIKFERAELARAEARAALLGETAGARRRSLAVVLGGGHSTRTRVKALAATLAPGRAASQLALQPRETTGGIRVPPPRQDVDHGP